MITLFRRIRQKLINSGSVTKYLLYATGEILLVVIGILIALQVNNWNEDRKNQELSKQYLTSLRADLNEDLEMLNEEYEFGLADSVYTNSIINRIKDSQLNPDTIKTVVLFEFNALVRAPRPHNRKTYNTLISTGDIGLLNNDIAQNLIQLNKKQDVIIRLIEAPLDLYNPIFMTFSKEYPLMFNKEYPSFSPFSEDLLPVLYDQIDTIQLLTDFNQLASLKAIIANRLMMRKRQLEPQTKDLIERIDQILK